MTPRRVALSLLIGFCALIFWGNLEAFLAFVSVITFLALMVCFIMAILENRWDVWNI